MSSSSSLHLKVEKALLVVAILALYAAIRKGIYEDEDADEEEMGVLLCVVVVVGIARAGDIQADGHCRTRSILIGVLQHLSLSLSLFRAHMLVLILPCLAWLHVRFWVVTLTSPDDKRC